MSQNESLEVSAKIQVEAIEPVRKEIQVSLSPEAAFRLFTDGIARWWPLRSHSVGEEKAESCVFEGRVGGRIYEIMQGGRQAEWGRVLSYEPPRRVVFSWYPGRTQATAQEVTLTFTPVEAGTLVELVHRGWETLGEKAQEMRRGYHTGWDTVLDEFRQHASG